MIGFFVTNNVAQEAIWVVRTLTEVFPEFLRFIYSNHSV